MDRLSLLIAYDCSCLVTYNNKLLCHRETHCSKRDKAGIRDQVVRGVRKGGREKKASWRPGLSTPTSGYFGEGVGFFFAALPSICSSFVVAPQRAHRAQNGAERDQE